MYVHESALTTADVLDDQIYNETLQNSRPQPDRTDSCQTKQNTRRNSLKPTDVLPESLVYSSPLTIAGLPSPTSPTLTQDACQRCSGEGEVAIPCRFCKATGKVIQAQSCTDCEAEKNGCGNTNCGTCHGVGRVTAQSACQSCRGSGSGLKLTCGDCGGSGDVTPENSRSSSEAGCGTIPE